jgi:hypothetical protein
MIKYCFYISLISSWWSVGVSQNVWAEGRLIILFEIVQLGLCVTSLCIRHYPSSIVKTAHRPTPNQPHHEPSQNRNIAHHVASLNDRAWSVLWDPFWYTKGQGSGSDYLQLDQMIIRIWFAPRLVTLDSSWLIRHFPSGTASFRPQHFSTVWNVSLAEDFISSIMLSVVWSCQRNN